MSSFCATCQSKIKSMVKEWVVSLTFWENRLNAVLRQSFLQSTWMLKSPTTIELTKPNNWTKTDKNTGKLDRMDGEMDEI